MYIMNQLKCLFFCLYFYSKLSNFVENSRTRKLMGVGFPLLHQRPKMLPGRVKRWGRVLQAHWLIKRMGGARCFRYLKLCPACDGSFPAGLAFGGWHRGLTSALISFFLYHSSIQPYYLTVGEDVFFSQSIPGRQLSSVSSRGQELEETVLGQPAAQANWTEKDQSEGRSRSELQEWDWWVVTDFLLDLNKRLWLGWDANRASVLFCLQAVFTPKSDTLSLVLSGSPADTSLSEFDNSIFSEPLEETLAAEITETITESLRNASHNLGCSRLLLPDCLQYSISQELLHLSSCEPCGLKGALIDLCIDRGDQDSLCNVEQIVVDASLVPTFHVTLVLRLEAGGLWPKVQKLFKGSRSPQRSGTSPRHRSIQRLSTSFRAIKRKLYSSEDLLIKECCWPNTPGAQFHVDHGKISDTSGTDLLPQKLNLLYTSVLFSGIFSWLLFNQREWCINRESLWILSNTRKVWRMCLRMLSTRNSFCY